MTEIVLAPFSNNPLRDWPAAHYRETIRLLLELSVPAARVSVIGTRGQRVGASEIVRPFSADRVFNDCGLAWDTVVDKLRRAACVIGNNSGITHASRYFGVPTVCVFGGSHQRAEWGPLGSNVVILSRVIGCSPCQLNHASECPYGAACLWEITPNEVVAAATRMIAGTLAAPAAKGSDEGATSGGSDDRRIGTC